MKAVFGFSGGEHKLRLNHAFVKSMTFCSVVVLLWDKSISYLVVLLARKSLFFTYRSMNTLNKIRLVWKTTSKHSTTNNRVYIKLIPCIAI